MRLAEQPTTRDRSARCTGLMLVHYGFAATCLVALLADASPARRVIVVCSPGSPGSTDEAAPRMTAFAAAVSAKAGVSISAVYDPTDGGGATRLAGSGLGIVSMPFFLEHERELGLHARLAVAQKGRPALERWMLVAPKGQIRDAGTLAGFTIVSTAAFAPAFVRGVVRGELGALPAQVTVTGATAVLSALRRAAGGERVAVLLDGPQAAALGSLAFADKLEVVVRSPALPAGLVVTIDKQIGDHDWAPIAAALNQLASDRTATAALDAIQIAGFAPVDEHALAAARHLYTEGAR